MSPPPRYTIDDIKALLTAQAHQVAYHYARPAPGAYEDKGLYFTLNPGRHDRSVGSFCIALSGPRAGRWNDYATGQHGDLIDLIGLSLGLSPADALTEARRFLGLADDTPEARAARDRAIRAQEARRRTEAEQLARKAEKRRAAAQAMWINAQPIAGSPVEAYLAGRAINLRDLGAVPGSLRFDPDCRYWWRQIDRSTGEVFEIDQRGPAMLAAIVGDGPDMIAVHRTWLARDPNGRWTKARILHPGTGEVLPVKKVLGDMKGGSIRLGNGIGPRGGKGPGLSSAPQGSRVVVAEGIETALSARILRPQERVLAAVSLPNMADIWLPPGITEVVLISDGDSNDQARAQMDRATASHQRQGRRVRIWASDVPGEDLNDALQRAKKQQEEGQTDEP